MEPSNTMQEIIDRLGKLTPLQQKQILNTVLTLLGEPIKGTTGEEMLKFVGLIPEEDLKQMKRAIEEDCRKIDDSEW